jgi:hypothetical protein
MRENNANIIAQHLQLLVLMWVLSDLNLGQKFAVFTEIFMVFLTASRKWCRTLKKAINTFFVFTTN